MSTEETGPKEEKSNLRDTIFWGTTLPEVHGELFAIRALLSQLLALHDREQIEDIFNRASERAAKWHADLEESAKGQNEQGRDVFNRMIETSKEVLSGMKERLLSADAGQAEQPAEVIKDPPVVSDVGQPEGDS